MRPIPKKLLREILSDPYYSTCIHAGRAESTPCRGRITLEHAFCYAGRQINEKWAIVPCCFVHNVGVNSPEKDFNQLTAIKRATAEDLKKYPANWHQVRARLEYRVSQQKPHGEFVVPIF